MALSDTKLRNLPASFKGKLFDSGGLFLLAKPSTRSPKGSRLWRLKYYFAGKEKSLALGAYPEVTLQHARKLRDKYKAMLADNIDPSEDRKASYSALKESAENSFEAVATEWFAKQATQLDPKTHKKAVALMEKWVYPWIGRRPIASITPKELFAAVLKRVEASGRLETTHRVKQRCGQIFRYAMLTGRAQHNPAEAMRGALLTPRARNHSAIIEPEKVGALLRAIDGFEGQFVTQCALKLSPLLFVRPGELRRAEWEEMNFEDALWTIPAAKMKMRKDHLVPLARQSLALLRDLRHLTGNGKYVFPGSHSKERPMSENTVNGALRRIGYSGAEMVAHGFRATASSNLNEQGWRADAIERQLAHVEESGSRAPYHRTPYFEERVKMMQAWADFLDALRASVDSDGVLAAKRRLFAEARESFTLTTT